jgi:hypothetical protein
VRRNPDITGAFEHMLAFWTVRIHEGLLKVLVVKSNT